MNKINEKIDNTNEFNNSSDKETFDMIASEINYQMEQLNIKSDKDFSEDSNTAEFLHNVHLVVKYAPGLKLIGEGSSRYVYKMGSGKYVLKLAKNYMGLIQNKNEIDVNKVGSADYDCFVRILAYDPFNVFIIEDLCEELPSSGWQPLFGISLYQFIQIVRIVIDRKKDNKAYSVADFLLECESLDKNSKEIFEIFKPTSPSDVPYRSTDYDKIISFLKNIVLAAEGKPTSILWKSLFDVFRFYFDNGGNWLVLDELPWEDQWGTFGSGNDKRIVLIDPGVNSDFAK